MIACNCDCSYQCGGYCKLDNAAEVTSSPKENGCLYYVERGKTKKAEPSKGPADS